MKERVRGRLQRATICNINYKKEKIPLLLSLKCLSTCLLQFKLNWLEAHSAHKERESLESLGILEDAHRVPGRFWFCVLASADFILCAGNFGKPMLFIWHSVPCTECPRSSMAFSPAGVSIRSKLTGFSCPQLNSEFDETTKLPQEEKKIKDLGIDGFLDTTPKEWSLKGKDNHLDFLKIKTFYSAKTLKRMKRQACGREDYL